MALRAKERPSITLSKITQSYSNLPVIRSPNSSKTLPPSLILPNSPSSLSSLTKLSQGLPKVKTSVLDHSALLEPITRPSALRNTTQPEISPRKTEFETNRAVKFNVAPLPRTNEITPQEEKEESNSRYKTIWTYIRSMAEIQLESEKQEVKLNEEKYLVETEKVIGLAEKAFSVLNIQTKVILEPVADSAMTLFPATESGELSSFYYMMLQEVSDFPYFFLSKLKVLLLTICEEVILANSTYVKVLKQKMNNGLCILSKASTRDAVRDYWYRIVLYHFVRQNPILYDKWRDCFGGERRNEMDDMVQALNCLMRPGKSSRIGLSQADLKIRLLKEELLKFEPKFFDDEWWTLKRSEQAK